MGEGCPLGTRGLGFDVRDDFPGLGRFKAYLNTAAVGLPPASALESLHGLLLGRYSGDPLSAEREAGGEAARAAQLLEVLYGIPAGEIAWGESTTHMVGRLVLSLAGPGDVVAVGEEEFPGVTFHIATWCRRLGCRVRVARGWPPEEALEAAVDEGARVIVASSVSWVRGWRLDVARVARYASRRGARLVVDAIQHLGALGAGDLMEADAFCASVKKWLLAPHSGVAFCRVSRRLWDAEPPGYSVPGAAVGDVQRFWADPSKDPASPPPPAPGAERFAAPSSPGYAQLVAFRLVLEYLEHLASLGAGPVAVEAHVARLRGALEDLLEDAGIGYYQAPPGRASGILLIRTGLAAGEEVELAQRLEARGVSVTARGQAGAHGIRASVHLYNTEEDLHALVEALRAEVPRR